MIKIMSIFGTRAEAIKMAPLIKKMEQNTNINSIICVTGQHREMLNQVLETFKIIPNYNLNIMKVGQTLGDITTNSLSGIEDIIKKEKPNIVLVHGDTTTTFTGALAAFYNKVPIGHIEAGLRTYNRYSPYPEEMNRQLVSKLADIHFTPTYQNKQNLLKEGIEEKNIFVTGNTIIDVLSLTINDKYESNITEWIGSSKMILLTSHRRENIGEPMKNCFKAIKKIINENPDIKVVFPIHKNPEVRKLANEIFMRVERIKIIEPLNIYDFDNLQNNAYLILTDSGGIQETAPSLSIPVLVMRDTTERIEGMQAGTVKLIGTEEDKVFNEINNILHNKSEYKKMQKSINPYGDGFASDRIIKTILDLYKYE